MSFSSLAHCGKKKSVKSWASLLSQSCTQHSPHCCTDCKAAIGLGQGGWYKTPSPLHPNKNLHGKNHSNFRVQNIATKVACNQFSKIQSLQLFTDFLIRIALSVPPYRRAEFFEKNTHFTFYIVRNHRRSLSTENMVHCTVWRLSYTIFGSCLMDCNISI